MVPVSEAHAQGAQTLEQAFDNVGITSPAGPSDVAKSWSSVSAHPSYGPAKESSPTGAKVES